MGMYKFHLDHPSIHKTHCAFPIIRRMVGVVLEPIELWRLSFGTINLIWFNLSISRLKFHSGDSQGVCIHVWIVERTKQYVRQSSGELPFSDHPHTHTRTTPRYGHCCRCADLRLRSNQQSLRITFVRSFCSVCASANSQFKCQTTILTLIYTYYIFTHITYYMTTFRTYLDVYDGVRFPSRKWLKARARAFSDTRSNARSDTQWQIYHFPIIHHATALEYVCGWCFRCARIHARNLCYSMRDNAYINRRLHTPDRLSCDAGTGNVTGLLLRPTVAAATTVIPLATTTAGQLDREV